MFPAQASNQSTNQLDVTSGKFDWAYNFLPDVKKTFVARDPKHNIYWFPPGGAIGLYLNLTKAPYSDVDFRKGVSLALNRTTIATKAVNGYLDQASMSGLILPNLKKWLDPSLPNQGQVTQNAAGAKAAFAQAGYTSKGGKLVGRQAGGHVDRHADQLQRLGRRRQGGQHPAPRSASRPSSTCRSSRSTSSDRGRHVRRGHGRLRRHR